ncbi:MAG: hypothetical protein M0Q98_07060 [Pseudomonas sp.]|nr:hypothetical protein [Pseudomonas sp.]MDD2222760.1 hypothetical protein [Pseudomonas sp.]MDY0415403.1 hypothetical protein [Pseudomonas sp.]NLO53300.1 hypothetical protein [Gammaproteobacteria bacterium]
MLHFRAFSLLVLLASLSACQLLTPSASPTQPALRMQGTITNSEGQWVFQQCNRPNAYIINSSSALDQEFVPLITAAPNGFFADLSGDLDAAQQRFTPTQRYRLEIEGHDCSDPDFARLQLRASGNEPAWSILQTPRGLIFNQIGEAALVLPYIEEQLPNGRFHLSSQANNQNLDIWITTQQCIDNMSGAVYHLQAKLQWNQQTFNGCAAFGALRD